MHVLPAKPIYTHLKELQKNPKPSHLDVNRRMEKVEFSSTMNSQEFDVCSVKKG